MPSRKKSEFTFTWKIENFSFCPYESILSPFFTAENLSQKPWCLLLIPRCDESSDVVYVQCELRSYDDQLAKAVINYKIELIGPNGHVLGVYEEKSAVFDDENYVTGSCFVNRAPIIRNISTTNVDILTVRCHMSSAKSSGENYVDSFARTKIIVNRQNVQVGWTEEDEINRLLDMEHKRVSRVDMYCPDMAKYVIHLEKVNDYVEISITSFHCNLPQCVTCEITLLDVNECQVLSVKDSTMFTRRINPWKFPFNFPTSELKCNPSKYIKNGMMTVLFELIYSNGIESHEVLYKIRKPAVDIITDADDNQRTLLSDVRNLFSDETLCDVKLRVNDEIIQAHKLILAARSPVFRAMFQQDMAEAQTGIVDIRDVDSDTFKAFVNFLYCDTVEKMDFDCAKNLLIVAEKYQVLRLKEICSTFFVSNASVRNACEVAALADMVSDPGLKSFMVNFIADNSKDILSMPNWIMWTKNHIELATEVFQKLTEKQTLT